MGMVSILSALVSLLFFRVRCRASLELETRRPSASVERRAAAAQRSPLALLHRSAALGLAVPDLAADPERHGAGEAGNRDPVESQRLPAILAGVIRIALSGSTEDEHRDPRSDPPDEHGQPALGSKHSRTCKPNAFKGRSVGSPRKVAAQHQLGSNRRRSGRAASAAGVSIGRE
jgi:hypothetical protein